MKKRTKAITAKIVDMIRADTYSIAEIAAAVGIDRRTFYRWYADDADFSAAVDDARAELLERVAAAAKRSLMRKIEGYDTKETKVVTIPTGKIDPETGKPAAKVKEQHTTTKHVAPDTAAIIFALTNADPDNWRNRRTTEVTGKDGKDLFQDKTDEELDKEIARLRFKLDETDGFKSNEVPKNTYKPKD